jgi:hypothetical protein
LRHCYRELCRWCTLPPYIHLHNVVLTTHINTQLLLTMICHTLPTIGELFGQPLDAKPLASQGCRSSQ